MNFKLINTEKYKDKGLTGLANLGNTCYINSCLQILSHCYIFNNLIDNYDLNKLNQVNDSVLFIEWKKLKDLMWSKNCTISPNRFIKIVQTISKDKNLELFSGYAQNDLPEFLIFIIDCFNNSIKRNVEMSINGIVKNETDSLAKECYNMIKQTYSENYSELLDMFYGIHVSIIESTLDESKLAHRPEPFSILHLPIPILDNSNTCNIYDCLDFYTNKELLNNDNSYYNEKTKKYEEVYKYLTFWSLPNILVITFKRFDNNNRKINKLIDTPLLNLDLRKYIIGYDKEKYIYELFGITNHYGGCLGGHYTSFVKNANNNWYHFNDTNVNTVDVSKIITNNAYCYFYKNVNI